MLNFSDFYTQMQQQHVKALKRKNKKYRKSPYERIRKPGSLTYGNTFGPPPTLNRGAGGDAPSSSTYALGG